MKRDMDLIREILLFVEGLEVPRSPLLNDQNIESLVGIRCSYRSLVEHVSLLEEAGYLRPTTRVTGGVYIGSLTMDGHDFLDSIRDGEIWKGTKDAAEKAGGFTIELLGEIAKGLIKTQLKKHTGVEI